jgi:nucleotide-binding universal stress UspA family protein
LNFLVDSAEGFKDIDIHLLAVAKSESDAVKSQELADAQQTLQQAGCTPTASLRSGDPEKVIADYIEQNQMSLLMMGAYGHSRIRHLVIGSTTVQLLRSVQVPVLLFR